MRTHTKFAFLAGAFGLGAAGMYFLVLSTIIALWSGINYHIQFLRIRLVREGQNRTA